MGSIGQEAGPDDADVPEVSFEEVAQASFKEAVGYRCPCVRRRRTRSPLEHAAALPPMDTGTYEVLLKQRNFDLDEVEERRGKGVRKRCRPHNKKEETSWDVCLREDLAKNKVVWYNHWLLDLWCFCRNANPILALFFSHKKHPISWKERYYITLMSFVFVMMVSIACSECSDCIACGITSCESNSQCVASVEVQSSTSTAPRSGLGLSDNSSVVSTRALQHDWYEARRENLMTKRKTPPLNYCCTCVRSGATWLISSVNIDLGILLISGTAFYQLLANIIFGQLHFQLAACGCCQRRGNRERKKWYICAWIAMGLTFPLLMVFAPIFIEYAVYNDLVEVTLSSFVAGQFKAKIITSAFQTLVFSFLWWSQRRSGGDGFHVSADEFLTLRHARVRDALQPELLPAGIAEDPEQGGEASGGEPPVQPPASRPCGLGSDAASGAASGEASGGEPTPAAPEDPETPEPPERPSSNSAGTGADRFEGEASRRTYMHPTASKKVWNTFVSSLGA